MSVHDCPCCVCGLTHLTWSDRETWVRCDDVVDVAGAIASCALDHYYDRPYDGVPYGLDERDREAVIPVVQRHLSAAVPDWREHSVPWGDAARVRAALCPELEAALRAARAATT